MRGHPLHGTNPLAKKLTQRVDWGGDSKRLEIWKVLSRARGAIAWDCEQRVGEQVARTLGAVRVQEGKEVQISRL